MEAAVFIFIEEREGFEPSELAFNGFQDRRNRPLCHLSAPFYFTGLRPNFQILSNAGMPKPALAPI